jgi:hypothetical protein
MISQSARIFKLPTELIHIIGKHLPPDAVVALKLTCHALYERVLLEKVPKNTTLSRCERLAISAYLSKDHSTLRCIRCKSIYPINSFKSSNSPACVSASIRGDAQQIEVVELLPRICNLHVGALARFVDTKQGGRDEWASKMDRMCMHCGAVQGWMKCNCNCKTCCVRPVRTYTRYISNKKTRPEFQFWRDQEGQDAGDQKQLMVRETYWDSGECNVVDRKVHVVYGL